MFEVGFTELLLIFALALVVLGPEKLPRVASQVGRWIGRARAMARQFREQLEEEVDLDPADGHAHRRHRPHTVRPSASPEPEPEPAVAEPDPPLEPGPPLDPQHATPGDPPHEAASDASVPPPVTAGTPDSDGSKSAHERGT